MGFLAFLIVNMSKLLDEETVIDNITDKCKKSYFTFIGFADSIYIYIGIEYPYKVYEDKNELLNEILKK